jgi:hypothetical protein
MLERKKRLYSPACLSFNKDGKYSSSFSRWEMGIEEKRYRRNILR